MAVPIPEDFRDLFEKPVYVSLVTILPNGQPHATPIWIDYDGTNVIVNTVRGHQKDKDMHRNGIVTILSVDPGNPFRWIEVRGTVIDENEEGAVEHINKLSMKYQNKPDYYERIPNLRGVEKRVLYTIEPTKITSSGRYRKS